MGFTNNLMTTSMNAVKILDNNKGTILLGAGLTAGVGTVICASIATLKSKDIIDDHKKHISEIKDRCLVDLDYAGSTDFNKDIITTSVHTTTKVAKMYAPAVVLGATSAACLIGEHCVMQKKINNLEKTVASLSAAYIAVDTAFKEYRKRVVKKYGKDEDFKLRYDIQEETEEIKDENGKIKKVKKEHAGNISMTATTKFVDGTNGSGKGVVIWKDPYHHEIDYPATIRQFKLIESYVNDKLSTKKFVFLNEALEACDIETTKAGQVILWKTTPDDPDNMQRIVDFGINKVPNRRLATGEDIDHSDCLVLEFNCNGTISDLDPSYIADM